METLEEVETLLLEACKLENNINNKKDFDSAFFEDFVEVKGNDNFINKNQFSDNNSDQSSD